MSEFATRYRTHTCGELRASHVVKPRSRPQPTPLDDMDVALPRSPSGTPAVMLAGHVDSRVDETTVILRDRYGKTLITADAAALPYVAERFVKLEPEDVIQVSGEVNLRAKKDESTPTGHIVLKASKIELLSKAEPLPEGVLRAAQVPLEERLTHRQLYLRRTDVKDRLAFRARVAHETREFLTGQHFLELETPQLFWYDKVATNPEIVPAGTGKAFALPNGPVVLDQYLKPGGFDRFFQFLRITRRERSPTPLHAQEHTGLDINLAYVDVDDFIKMMDGLLAHLWRTILGETLETPRRYTYAEALEKFGTDRVDARFGLELVDLPAAAAPGGFARGFRAPQVPAAVTDAAIAEAAAANPRGAQVSWVRFNKPLAGSSLDFDLRGPAAALFSGKAELVHKVGATAGDVVVVATGATAEIAGAAAGAARLALGRKLGLADPKKHVPVWIHSYPFLEDDEGNLVPRVVVFARAHPADMMLLMKDFYRGLVRSKTFDLVIDGTEVASGYIGNHMLQVQRDMWKKFFMLSTPDLVRLRAPIEAHRFGVPPHGGINVGFDRLVGRLLGIDAIDEVMTFPKSPECRDLLVDAPGPVPREPVAEFIEAVPKPTYTEKDLAEEVTKA